MKPNLDSEYGKRYRELYERHWWWRSREAAVLSVLRRRLPPGQPREILDVGCGDGLFFRALGEFGSVEGLESSAELLTTDGEFRSRIHVAPFDGAFQPGKRYGLILMLDVLEHLADPHAALRQAESLLARGGLLVITVPAFRLLWTNHDVLNHHVIRYRRGTLRPLVERAGLRIIEERYWYQWMCPVKLAQRIVEGIFRLRPSPPNIPGKWLNSLLYWVSRWEQKTLAGWGAPFGSSLLIACAKTTPIHAK